MKTLNSILFVLAILLPTAIYAQPVNDDFANAVEATTDPFVDVVLGADAASAGQESGEPLCGASSSFWYTITPAASELYEITSGVDGADENTAGSDTQIGIYSGTALDNLVEVDCYDLDALDGFGESIRRFLTGGTTYYIKIGVVTPTAGDDIETSIASAPTLVWNGSVSSDWSTADNWTPAQVPSVNNEVIIVGGTSNDCAVSATTNAMARGVAVIQANLTVEDGGSLSLSGADYGLLVDGNSSSITIGGALNISDVSLAGLRIDGGVMNVTETGTLNVSNAGRDGIYLFGTLNHNGRAGVISGSGFDGIRVEGGTLNIQEDGKLVVASSTADGLFVIDDGTVNIAGELTSTNHGDDGVDTESGSLIIEASGTLLISNVGEVGFTDANFINNGTLTITNTDNDGINTKEDCVNNGTITITNAGSDGLDIEDETTFTNNGDLEIANSSSENIDDGIFVNADGGVVVIDGDIGSVFTSTTGSELAPGPGIVCIIAKDSTNLDGATVNFKIEGPTDYVDYDHLVAQDDLLIDGTILELSGDYVPELGDTFTIFYAEGTTPVGTIADLPESATLEFNGVELTITYLGGDGGQDVVLTAEGTPPPNDDLINAIVLDPNFENNQIEGINGRFATTEVDEINCGNTVSWWYALTPETTNTYRLIADEGNGNGIDSTNDVTLGIYTGSTHPLTEVVCYDNNNGETGGEQEEILLTGGVTYYLRVGVQGVPGQTEVRMTSIKRPFNWLGTEDSDWYNPNNWESGVVAGAGNDVFIFDPINSPVIGSGTVALSGISVSEASFTLAEGATLNLSGGNSGLTTSSGGEAFINGVVTIEEMEEIGFTTVFGAITVGATGSITVNGAACSNSTTLTIAGSVTINDSPGFGLICPGNSVVVVEEGGQLTINNATFSGLTAGNSFTNDGAISVSSSGMHGLLFSGTGNLVNGPTGSIEISDSGENGLFSVATGIIENAGLFAVSGSGENAFENGTINNVAGSTFRVDGTVNATANFAAGSRLEPGSSPGCLEFVGAVDLSETTVEIELEGTTACTDYDQVTALGALDLTDATLELVGDYAPQLGDEFLLFSVEGSAVTGTFAGLPEASVVSFNGAELAITYVGGDGNDVILTVESVFPVALISFTGQAAAKTNVLSWTTVAESGFSHFEIERLADTQWEYLGAAAGAREGTGEPTDYSFTDGQPLPAAYYRLKMMDLDGSFTYSHLIQITQDLNSSANKMSVYPNPNDGHFRIALFGVEGSVDLALYTIHGTRVRAQKVLSGTLLNWQPQGKIAPGVYVLVATGQKGRWTKQVVVR